jgi:hypothetical protein
MTNPDSGPLGMSPAAIDASAAAMKTKVEAWSRGPRARDNVCGLELWAIVSPGGAVVGTCTFARLLELGEPVPERAGDNRVLPLFGSEPLFDKDHDYLVPVYQVHDDHVARTIEVKRRGDA